MITEEIRHKIQCVESAPRNYCNDAERTEIQRQTDEYLARGGQIQEVGSEANRNPKFIPGCMVSRHGGFVSL